MVIEWTPGSRRRFWRKMLPYGILVVVSIVIMVITVNVRNSERQQDGPAPTQTRDPRE